MLNIKPGNIIYFEDIMDKPEYTSNLGVIYGFTSDSVLYLPLHIGYPDKCMFEDRYYHINDLMVEPKPSYKFKGYIDLSRTKSVTIPFSVVGEMNNINEVKDLIVQYNIYQGLCNNTIEHYKAL